MYGDLYSVLSGKIDYVIITITNAFTLQKKDYYVYIPLELRYDYK